MSDYQLTADERAVLEAVRGQALRTMELVRKTGLGRETVSDAIRSLARKSMVDVLKWQKGIIANAAGIAALEAAHSEPQAAPDASGVVMANPAFFGTREAYLQNSVETLEFDATLAAQEIERLTAANEKLEAKIARALAIEKKPFSETYGDDYNRKVIGYNSARDEFRAILLADDAKGEGA